MSTLSDMGTTPPIVAVLLAAVLAVAATWPAAIRPDALVGHWDNPDCLGNHWLLVWVAERLAHGQNLLHNTLYYFPHGDYPVVAGNGLEGVFYLPFHWLLPWPYSSTVWVLALLTVNGLVGWWAATQWGAGPRAAWLAIPAWGTNPYVLQELGSGRFTQADTLALGLYLGWLGGALRRADAGTLRTRDGALGGALLGLTAVLYWYYGYFALLATACAVALTWAQGTRLPARAMAAAAAACAVVAGPPLAAHLSAWTHVPGAAEIAVFPHPHAVGDGLGLASPIHHMGSHPGMAISIVLLGLIAMAVAKRRIGSVERRALLIGTLGLALALGTALGPGPLPSPYELAYGWLGPLRRFWWPSRHIVLVHFAIAVLATRAVGPLLARRRHATLIAAALTLLVPISLELTGDLAHSPVSAFRAPTLYTELAALPSGAVLELPLAPALGGNQQKLMYQLVHQKPLIGGHGQWIDRIRPAAFDHELGANSFYAGLVQWELHNTERLDFDIADLDRARSQGLRWVTLNPEYLPARMHTPYTHILRGLFGEPVISEGSALVFDATREPSSTSMALPQYRLQDGVSFGDGENRLVGPRGASLGLHLLRGTPMPFPGTHGGNRERGDGPHPTSRGL